MIARNKCGFKGEIGWKGEFRWKRVIGRGRVDGKEEQDGKPGLDVNAGGRKWMERRELTVGGEWMDGKVWMEVRNAS